MLPRTVYVILQFAVRKKNSPHGAVYFNQCNNCALCHLNNHLDGGQRGRQVLGVRWSDSDGHTAGVQAAVEGGNQVDSCSITVE